MQTPDLSAGVYQLRIVAQGVSPLIWCLLVRGDMSLAGLHDVLQITFAWSDAHLHGFQIHGKEYDSTCLGGPSFDTDLLPYLGRF
jgi:hypothetical protein